MSDELKGYIYIRDNEWYKLSNVYKIGITNSIEIENEKGRQNLSKSACRELQAKRQPENAPFLFQWPGLSAMGIDIRRR